jgi:hypothetical protein
MHGVKDLSSFEMTWCLLKKYCILAKNTQLITQALILPFFWLLAFIFITGIGLACMPFGKQKGVLAGSVFTGFWYGLGITILFLQVWNLFFPVNSLAWLCLLPVAIYGAWDLRHLRASFSKPGLLGGLLWLVIFLFLILSSLDNSYIFDTLVYHFYTIKWLGSYPVTPGMGNLFTYLGLNQSYFLYPAFLDALWGHYRGACAANGLLALVICSEIVYRNAACLQGKQKLSFYALFQLLFLPLCINIGVQNLSSPTPDVFINLLTFKVISDIIACIESKKITFQDIFLLAFYCLLGIVMKFSFIGVALGTAVVLIWLLVANKLYKAGSMLIALAFGLLLLVPWAIRGGISSGYIAFPVTMFPLPVDWKMPARELELFMAFVKGFARTHLHGQPGIDAAYTYTWIPGWIKRMATTFGFMVPVLLAIGTGIMLRLKRINAAKLYYVLVPLFIAIVFWLVTAPDIRFAVFTFWALGLAPLAYLISNAGVKYTRLFPAFISVCCLLIIIRNFNTDITPLGDVPPIKSTVFVTRSGLKINVVTNCATSDNWDIGDCTIPCSVHPDSSLTLRGSTIKDGFKLARPAKNNKPPAH